MNRKMTVSEYVAAFLVQKGIKDVFFIDGSACASLIVAVARNRDLRYFCPLHEQAGAFAVDGYFKATRRPTAMIATSGPGGINLLNGIATSYYDSIPAIHITGQINSRFLKPSAAVRQRGFQENDIVSMAKPITKYAVMVRKKEDIRFELEKAFYLATAGRPGPVMLDIPMDIQKMKIDERELTGYKIPSSPRSDSKNIKSDIQRCLDMLKGSKRPAILIGGGIWLADVSRKAKELISRLRIPFFVTWNMIDFCEEDFPLYGGRIGTFGGDGRNFGVQNCDLLLAIGSRISGRVTGGMVHTFAREARKIIVDVDMEELRYQAVKGDLNICCDAKTFIDEFLKTMKRAPNNPDWSRWASKVSHWKERYPVFQEEYWKQKASVNPYVFIRILSEGMKEGDILVHEAAGNCVVTSQTFRAKPNQRVFSNHGNSSLGYALPAAIGACIATRKPVFCITGDGGLNFNIQELQTIKHYGLPVKILVFNNYAFGITKLYRDTNFRSEYAGVDAKHGMSSPDFIKVAKAYGIETARIRDHKELKEKIGSILRANRPLLCDINMIGFYDYKPRLGWSSPIEDQYPFLPRDEFIKNMLIEPVEGWQDPVYPGRTCISGRACR